jgi:long-chain acyl-CoA synthetase
MPGFIKELSKHKFSVFTGVNTLFNGLMNQEDFQKLDFSALKITVGGGMAVQKATAEKWRKITGTPLAEGYGLTETSPVASCNPIDGTERIGTIGIPLPNTEMIIVDDAGQILPNGERGEICIKGPQVMKGYWNRPADTAEVMMGEWFKSGDIGIMDDDGYTQIVDRKKEMILVSGFNVYPNEVENVIASCQGVLEVGVIGMPDPKSTEKVVAYVVTKDKSLTDKIIFAHCQESLTNYKCPKEVYFIDELPKSNVGKILRRIIKEGHIEMIEAETA